MTNAYDEYAEMEASSRKRLEDAKAPLMTSLASLGVSTVVVDFDAMGDSGQIGSVLASDSHGERINLARPVPNSISEVWDEVSETLEEFIELFLWEALGVYHEGYEINDGSYGALTIDVGAGKFTIEHNQRYEEFSETEV